MSSSGSSLPRQHAYGVGAPSIRICPPPIISSRAPTTSDIRYPIGQNWVYQISATNASVYELGSVATGVATWVTLGGSSSDVNTLTGNTGGVISPTGGNINTLGTGSITIAGSGSTLTTQLTGMTNHSLLIGAGTATLTKLAPSATAGVAVVSTGAAADPAYGTVVVAGGGTGATTLTGIVTGNGTSAMTANAVTQHGVLIGGASNAASSLSVASTGTALLGVTGADPAFTALVTVNISDNTTGTVGSPTTMVVGTSYIADQASATTGFLLPATASRGDRIEIIGNGPGGWQIQQNANQAIKYSSQTSTTGTGGTVSSNTRYDAIQLYCVVGGASTIWNARTVSGTLNFV